MNRIILLGFVLFLALLSSQATIGTIDYTKVGVSNGDSFSFKLDEYTEIRDGKTTHEYNLGYDNVDYEDHYITEGTEFTMKIIDATPDIEEYDENYTSATIKAEFSYKNKNSEDIIFQTDQSLNSDLISNTDWEGNRAEMQKQIDDLENNIGPYEGNIDVEFIDNSKEFGYKLEYNLTLIDQGFGDNLSLNAVGEIRFDKETGVVNSIEIDLALDFLSSTDQSQSTHTKIHRLGIESDGVSLPGFEMILTVTSLYLTTIIIKRRKTNGYH